MQPHIDEYKKKKKKKNKQTNKQTKETKTKKKKKHRVAFKLSLQQPNFEKKKKIKTLGFKKSN